MNDQVTHLVRVTPPRNPTKIRNNKWQTRITIRNYGALKSSREEPPVEDVLNSRRVVAGTSCLLLTIISRAFLVTTMLAFVVFCSPNRVTL